MYAADELTNITACTLIRLGANRFSAAMCNARFGWLTLCFNIIGALVAWRRVMTLSVWFNRYGCECETGPQNVSVRLVRVVRLRCPLTTDYGPRPLDSDTM